MGYLEKGVFKVIKIKRAQCLYVGNCEFIWFFLLFVLKHIPSKRFREYEKEIQFRLTKRT